MATFLIAGIFVRFSVGSPRPDPPEADSDWLGLGKHRGVNIEHRTDILRDKGRSGWGLRVTQWEASMSVWRERYQGREK